VATSLEYIEYVCDQIRGVGEVRYKKMFGEYMAYINDKPVLLVCDNTVYVKCLDCISGKMKDAQLGEPYKSAKVHYILDIEDSDFSKEVILELEKVTPLPKPRKKKSRERSL
jgi:TfoX/Sxy family transcriptional regulator of competence genes